MTANCVHNEKKLRTHEHVPVGRQRVAGSTPTQLEDRLNLLHSRFGFGHQRVFGALVSAS